MRGLLQHFNEPNQICHQSARGSCFFTTSSLDLFADAYRTILQHLKQSFLQVTEGDRQTERERETRNFNYNLICKWFWQAAQWKTCLEIQVKSVDWEEGDTAQTKVDKCAEWIWMHKFDFEIYLFFVLAPILYTIFWFMLGKHNSTIFSPFCLDFKWGLSTAYQIITLIMWNKPNEQHVPHNFLTTS